MKLFFIIYLIIFIYFFIQDIILTKKENKQDIILTKKENKLNKEKNNLDISIKDIDNKV